MKHIIPILVILLLLSSGFVGVSNTAEEQWVDAEEMGQSTASDVGPMDSAWPMYQHDAANTGFSLSPFPDSLNLSYNLTYELVRELFPELLVKIP